MVSAGQTAGGPTHADDGHRGRRMTTLILTAALLFLWFQPVQAAGPTLGAYVCHGTQNGTAYEMPLTIAEFGHAYQLLWGDPPTVAGLGILHEGRLAVAL